MSPALVILGPEDAPRAASLHASSFPAPWPVHEFRQMLGAPNHLSIGIEDGPALAALLVILTSPDTADILTLATGPDHRRKGYGAKLIRAALKHLGERGIERLLLDVAADNMAGIALYSALGFSEDGRRKSYYKRGDGPRADAILMSRAVAGQVPL